MNQSLSTGEQKNLLYKQLSGLLEQAYCYSGWLPATEIAARKGRLSALLQQIEAL